MAVGLLSSGWSYVGPAITNISAAESSLDDTFAAVGAAAYANNIFRLSGWRVELLGMVAIALGNKGLRGPKLTKFLLVVDLVTTVYLLWMGSFAAVACFMLTLAFNKLGEKKSLGPLQGIYDAIQSNFLLKPVMNLIAIPGRHIKAVVVVSTIVILIFIPLTQSP